jgi:hypothetical protein
MDESSVRRLVAGITIVIGPLLVFASAARADAIPDREAIVRALKLLPRQPYKVLIVDSGAAQPPRHGKGQQVEAFVNHGDRVVHLVRRGVTLRQASNRGGIFDYALATVIWHEMAHIDGADEVTAQREEERLWRQFIVARRVDRVRGLQYLALLKKRHSSLR